MVYPRRLTIIPVLLILASMLAPTTFIGMAQDIEITFEPKRDVYPVGFTVTVKFNGFTPGTIYKIEVTYQGDANIQDALEIGEIEGMELIASEITTSAWLFIVNATATTASMKVKPLAAGTFQFIVKDVNDVELARSDKMIVSEELTIMEIQVFDAVTGQNITDKAIISLNGTIVQPPITVEIGKVYTVKVEAIGYETRTFLIKVEGPYIKWSVYLQPVGVEAVNLGNLTIKIQYSDGTLAKDVDLEVQVYSATTGKLVYAYYTVTGSVSIDYVPADKYIIYVFDPSMKYVGKSEVEVEAGKTVEATVVLEVNEIYRELEALKSKAETATSISGIAAGLGIVGAVGALLSFYKTSMEIAELKQDISTIQSDIEDLKSSIERLKAVMETVLAVADKVEKNSKAVSELKEAVSVLSVTVDKLATTLEDLSAKLKSTEDRVDNLAKTLVNLGSALRDLAIKVGELSRKASELEKENANLREKVVGVESVVATLEKTISDIQSKLRELADLSEDISKVRTSLQQLRDEVENIKRVVADLTTWSSEASRTLSELITRVSDNEKKVASIEERVDSIESKLTSIESRVSKLETTVEELQKVVRTVDELKTKLDSLSARVNKLSEDISGISGDISSLKSATEQTRKSVEGVAGQLMIAYGISIIGLLVAVAALFLIWRKITK
ncbi:MAG TPA: hypothetical protein EYH17_04980 [Pyrodictium sp.]|nr:hypothetical protein [Pyrodictium sp.]